MTPTLDELMDAAAKLPLSERARLVERLLATLEGATDAEAGEAWRVEIERRSKEIELGLVEGDSWPEVQAKLKRLRGQP